MTRAETIRAVLSHRLLAVALGVLALLLALPALWTGLHADDLAHGFALRGQPIYPAQSGSPMRLFSFADGDPEHNRRAMELGLLPWWSVETLRFNFWRPLAALTHALDYRLWPDSPVLMHVHSLVWFALLIASAALLYRRLLGATWLAGLAGLLFAVDDAHAVAAAWLASRNLLISGLFSILALIAHDRWRRDGSRSAAALAPLCLLLGLLGGEAAVATGGYLVAYTLFIDRGTWRARIMSLLPAAAVGVSWHLVYVELGYGTFGSGVYCDPVREPLRLATALLERAPLQLLAQWFFPPTDWYTSFSSVLARGVWVGALVFAGLLVIVLGPLLRTDGRARFLALGMLFALIPNCATVPTDRLLVLTGVGAFGLLALLIGGLADRWATLPQSRNWQVFACVFAWLLVFIHAIAAPIVLPVRVANQRDKLARRFVEALPNDPDVRSRQVVMVNAPSALWGTFLGTIRRQHGLAVPERVRVLASGMSPLEITRPGASTLVIRPVNGYLPPARTSPLGADMPAPHVSTAYILQQADLIFRDAGHRMRQGQRVELRGLTVEVTAVTADGRPAEATFRFDVPLTDPSLIWLQWTGNRSTRFDLPLPGETVVLPAFPDHK